MSKAFNTVPPPASPRVDHREGVSWHLEKLLALHPPLARLRQKTGEIEPRLYPKGFAGLAKVICGQQLSVTSAAAIWARFAALPGALAPQTYLELDAEKIRAAGLSHGKIRTLAGVATALRDGHLDLAAIEALPSDRAVAALRAHKGVGPWTAEVYLLFCAGHPDIFPAGDLALLKAAQHGLGLDARPTIKDMSALAAAWAPHRSVAALLFWRYFAVLRDREGVLL